MESGVREGVEELTTAAVICSASATSPTTVPTSAVSPACPNMSVTRNRGH
jgi:hypothetical protein